MGGSGSGRRWWFDANETTDDYRSIDVRRWKRWGRLEPGQVFAHRWLRNGEVCGSINVRIEPGRAILDYRHRSGDTEWQQECYPVALATTPCHLGGERHWFHCPARGCGRRVAILYGGGIFACRHCRRLAYPSQRERVMDRAARRADRIRDRLGWEPGILNGPGDKPKGMHWKTFDRLSNEHDALVNASMADVAKRLGFDL
jgi:hypothetical protein